MGSLVQNPTRDSAPSLQDVRDAARHATSDIGVDVCVAWLQTCRSACYANGAVLAHNLGSPGCASSSPCGEAHEFLTWCESRGLIERGVNQDLSNPTTRNVLFFDVNGDLKRQRSPVLYGFSLTHTLQTLNLK